MLLNSKKIVLVYHTFSREGHRMCENGYFGRQGTVTTDLLESQLSWLAEFAEFVSLDKIISRSRSKNWQVAVTLDDGYRNNISLALPIFERFEVPVTWFVSTKFVDGDHLPWWDLVDYAARVARPTLEIDTGKKRVSFNLANSSDRGSFRSRCQWWFQKAPTSVVSRVRREIETGIPGGLPSNAFAKPSEVKQASKSPWLRLGGHTVTHPNLSRQSPGDVRREIKEGKEKLESWTGRPVKWFAYPYGGRQHWNECTKRLVREEGFDGAVTTVRAYVDERTDRFEVPRLTVPNTRTLWKTKAWILATDTCREAYRLKRKLID